jgi:hypothetical protein
MSDEVRDTPPTIIGAIAAGVAPAPFLLTYAVLFILHGTVFPVDPPDITGSHGGEALAGVVALAFLLLLLLSLAWLLSGRTRWLFLAGQLATMGASVNFVLDSTSGQPDVPVVLIVASAVAIVLAVVPASWAWAAPQRDDDAPPAHAHRSAVEPYDRGRGIRPPIESMGGPIDPNGMVDEAPLRQPARGHRRR